MACARIEVAAREAELHAVDALEAPGVQVGLVLAGVIAKLQTVFAGVANPVREELVQRDGQILHFNSHALH